MIKSNSFSAENRLLYVTVDDMGGVKYNRRNAEINAANQQAQYAAQVTANQNLIKANPQGLDPTQNNLAPPVANVPKQQLGQAGFQTYDATTGKTTVAAPLGEIDQFALKRLMDSGMTEGQARDQITSLRPDVAQTMSNTGLPGSTARQSDVLKPLSIEEQARNAADQAEAAVGGPAASTEDRTKARQQAEANVYAAAGIEQKNKEMQQKKEASTAGTDTPPSPELQGLQAALASLSPEEQAILGPIINNIQSQTDQGLKDNAARSKALMEGGVIDGVNVPGLNPTFQKLQDGIDELKTMRTEMKASVDSLLKDTKDENQKLIDEQQQAANERLTWNQHQQEVELARQKTSTHNSMIAQFALGGGFGQDSALAAVRSSDAEFDQKLRDVQTEFGIQRTDLSAKFTGLYLQNNNEYRTASIKNAEDYVSSLERLNTQGQQNTVSFVNAQQGLLTKMWDNETQLRKDQAKNTLDLGKEMLGMINQKRDDARAQEQLGWSVLDKAIDDYGSGIPKSLLDRISKMLPGVDLADVARAKTLAQQKKAGGGGGGSLGLMFDPNSMGPDGSAPSYETFVANKKMALKNDPTMTIEDAQKALDPARLKEEYKASLSAQNQGNASTIAQEFERRATAKGLTGPQYTRSAGLVEKYLKAGRNDLAQGIVDSIGDDVSDTANTNFVNALGTRSQLVSLHDAVQDLKTRGPLTGKLNNLNLNDPAIKRVQFFITATVPGMARGIFQEVGVLTDQDVERYTKILENPDLTIEQSINTYNDLMSIVNVRMQNQIASWEANGKRTAGYRQLFNDSVTNNAYQTTPQYSDDDVANSILH